MANKPTPSKAYVRGSGVAQFGPVDGAGHLGDTGGQGMGGVTGGLQTMGGQLGMTTGLQSAAIGRSQRMFGVVGILSSGSQ